ncbi:hypothetical protein [Mycolicibacterium sp. P9-64]|uniref:hypothetical protein n=1 Tax=Mycolicibacterium sp. P9-64 TaxID=2024612 RepID=UPI001F5BC7AE|nr:hypothetical protein [Mycolicibacterium sp. P9-64]
MDSPEFKPSVDWSNELVNSTVWVLEAFAIAALCVVVVLVLLRRYTGWGRQFWRITGDYFGGRASLPVWPALAALLASAAVSVRVSVLISYYANGLFSALQVAFEGSGSSQSSLKRTGVHGFWMSMGIFAILATVAAVRSCSTSTSRSGSSSAGECG